MLLPAVGLFPGTLCAQTVGEVSGTLLEQATRQPLRFANVLLLRLPDSTLVGTTQTAAAISGIIPENAIDATDISSKRNFLSQKNMNASSRRMQFGIRFIF